MYYILNETNQIIAADETLLNLCGVAHINELSAKMDQEQALLDTLETAGAFSFKRTALASTLGDLTLVGLKRDNAAIELDLSSPETNDDELFTLLEDSPEIASKEVEEVTTPILEDDTPLDLGLDDPSEVNEVSETAEVALADIAIDIDALSETIGISSADYHGFLNEFIDNAIDLESDLQSSDTNTRTSATQTLSSLSNVLHLPMVGEIIQNIANSDAPENALKSFYEVLSRITTTKTSEISDSQEETQEETLELFDTTAEKETPQEPEVETRKIPAGGFGTISLEGIKPVHFDFQLEEAANDLSLPVELIEEFVHDFIEQAHIETKKMLQAYEEGDLDAIQKIGHLLKGASSNLRINALSDTLYKIQFTETSDNLEAYIKDYWAHFLDFENQINVISH